MHCPKTRLSQLVLPEWVAVDFSAATGAYTLESHVIKSWEFNSILDSDELSKRNNHTEKSSKN